MRCFLQFEHAVDSDSIPQPDEASLEDQRTLISNYRIKTVIDLRSKYLWSVGPLLSRLANQRYENRACPAGEEA